jgi:hypothetical protein
MVRIVRSSKASARKRPVAAAVPLREIPDGNFGACRVFLKSFSGKGFTMLGTILIVVLLLLLLGAWPSWPYSSGWGYYPSGTLGLVLVVVLVLALMGRI